MNSLALRNVGDETQWCGVSADIYLEVDTLKNPPHMAIELAMEVPGLDSIADQRSPDMSILHNVL